MRLLLFFCLLNINAFSQDFDPKTVALIDDNKLVEATNRLEKLYKKNLESLDYLYLKGKIERKKGNYEEANIVLQKAISYDSNFIYAMDELAVIQAINGNYPESMVLFEKALKIKNQDPIVLAHRGATYFLMNEYSSAIEDFLLVLKQEPNNDYSLLNLGLCYLSMEKYDEAISNLTNSIRIRKKDPKAYFERGKAYYYSEQYELALKDFQKVMKLDRTENEFEIISIESLNQFIESCNDQLIDKTSN